MTRIKDGIIHLHTDNSKQDGFQSVAAAVKRAKELGAPAVTLTDHGVMTGIYEFISECEKAGIKPIPGVEAYKEDDDSNIGRCHLLLLPKNYEGLIAIGKAVTASNTRLQGGFPRMDDEILKKYFGPGSKGYGNVIATSACAGGVLARVLLFNDKVANEIQKIQKKISELRAHDSGYEKLQNDFYEAELKLKEAEEHLAQATEISKKSIRGIRSRFEKMKSDDSDYEKLKKIIEEYDQAVSDKVTYKMLKKQYQNVVSEAKKRLTPYLVDDEKRTEFEQALSELDSQIIDKDTLHKRTKDEAKKYVGIFGKGNFYIELQYHGIEEEGYVYPLLAEIAEEMGIPVVADPKGNQIDKYANVTMCTPNKKELKELTGVEITSEDALSKAAEMMLDAGIKYVLVTRSEEGMTLFDSLKRTDYPTMAKDIIDVTGAGDTVVAVAACALSSGCSMDTLCNLSNLAASVTISKFGTSAVTYESLMQKISESIGCDKRLSEDTINQVIQKLKDSNKKIVFTNGCFDLCHPGHVHLLKEAARLGDVLIVGLNSDNSVKRIKGEGRPIINEENRAYLLESLEAVDYVVVFDDDTPLELIRKIKPDILVKGEDWKGKKVVGEDILKEYGGRIEFIKAYESFSTTAIIEKMQGKQ